MVKLILKLACLTFFPPMWSLYWFAGWVACWAFHIASVVSVLALNVCVVWPEQFTYQLINQALHLQIPLWAYSTVPAPDDFSAPAGWILAIGIVTYAILALVAVFQYYIDSYR